LEDSITLSISVCKLSKNMQLKGKKFFLNHKKKDRKLYSEVVLFEAPFRHIILAPKKLSTNLVRARHKIKSLYMKPENQDLIKFRSKF